MVALLGLFQAVEIFVQLASVAPGGAVDALELGILGVAAPIGAGDLGQLECVAHVRGGAKMRAAAEVMPVAMPIDRDILIGGNALDQFRLIGLADPLEVID